MIGNDNKLFSARGHNFFLGQATTSALDQGQFRVALISTINGDIQLK
jgi:hypothetical protein